MNIEYALYLFNRLESRRLDSAPNFLAQANARYILFNVNESRENFPAYRSNLNEGLDGIAFSYLSIGCCLIEKAGFEYKEGIKALERGASALEFNHLPAINRIAESPYFLLVSALTYYASGQYSKAFVLMRDVEMTSSTGQMCSLFFKKDFSRLNNLLNEILLDPNYFSDQELEAREKNDRIRTFLFARSMSNLMEFNFTGENRFHEKAFEIVSEVMELAEYDEEPSLWWVARLFRLIIRGLLESSVWTTIPPQLLAGTHSAHPQIFSRTRAERRRRLVNQYVSSLIFRHPFPVTELFISQRKGLEQALGNHGAVICLPTSSGKTKVAELAILQCLLENTNAKVLYLAPFRSLAFEVEETLEKAFAVSRFKVSHLYGGNHFGNLDRLMIQESHVLIATPEKAKAILRASEEIATQIKLVIIDEGHLIDYSDRYIGHEMFFEELRRRLELNDGKIILLSAVLPNPEQLTEWIAGDSGYLAKDSWRPSSQRFGILEFHNNKVSLEWQGEEQAFNPNFIKARKPEGDGAIFPVNKREAVAATAVRLSLGGTVLIYVPRAKMVKSMAESVLTAILFEPDDTFRWRFTNEWQAFLLSVRECFGQNSDLERFAQHGILCHFGTLPNEVRYFTERLMRIDKPRIIVSTNTLAQGVNLGVSSVIISDVWIDPSIGHKLSYRDFHNISGRAGRAFVDSEGKVLFAIDRSNKPDWYRAMANKYFDVLQMDVTTSGLLTYIHNIKRIAASCRIPFDHLLELIAENDFTGFRGVNGENYSGDLEEFFEKIDDTLLAVEASYAEADGSESAETHFRKSLAVIQAKYTGQLEPEEVIAFLQARLDALRKKIVPERANWRKLITSGLPLRAALALENLNEEILQAVGRYNESAQNLNDRLDFFKELESLIRNLPSRQFNEIPQDELLDDIREAWLSGNQLPKSKGKNDPQKICNSYFCFTIPWALNASARQMQLSGHDAEASVLEELALLSELGLPNYSAAKIYLSGIRSRHAASELSSMVPESGQGETLHSITQSLLEQYRKGLLPNCTEATLRWLELFSNQRAPFHWRVRRISSFSLGEDTSVVSDILFVKSIGEKIFLCSPDFSEKIPVQSTPDLPFIDISNNTGIYFKRENGNWEMKCRNPFVEVI